MDEAALDAMTLASNRPKGDEESRDDGWIEAWLESVVAGGGVAFPNAAADPERRSGPTTRGAAVPTYFVRLVLHSPHDLQFEYESIAAKRLALECVDAETRGGRARAKAKKTGWNPSRLIEADSACRASFFFEPTAVLAEAALGAMTRVSRRRGGVPSDSSASLEESLEDESGASLSDWAAFVAIHVRTGFADFQTRWAETFGAGDEASQRALRAIEARFPCDAAVASLGRAFERCDENFSNQICSLWHHAPVEAFSESEETSSNASEGTSNGTRTEPERWTGSVRGPTAEDAYLRCASAKDRNAHVPEAFRPDLRYASADRPNVGVGAAAAGVACATRLAAFYAEERAKDSSEDSSETPSKDSAETPSKDSSEASKDSKSSSDDILKTSSSDAWGVYVLGDAPGFIDALMRDDALAGRVASQPGSRVVGVTMERETKVHRDEPRVPGSTPDGVHRAAAEEEEDAAAAAAAADASASNLAWRRAATDMFVASLADGAVNLPGSSFLKGGAQILSLTLRSPDALGFAGEVVLDQVVRRANETAPRRAGFDEDPRNFVMLAMPHCAGREGE